MNCEDFEQIVETDHPILKYKTGDHYIETPQLLLGPYTYDEAFQVCENLVNSATTDMTPQQWWYECRKDSITWSKQQGVI